MDLYSTHVPYLARAIMKLGGPVLELGAGWYSTPLIRAMTDKVTTIETNGSWIQQFNCYCENNPIVLVSNFESGVDPYLDLPWNVVFVDCEYAPQRVYAACRLTKAVCVVCHDTENDYWNPVFERYKYQKHFKFVKPYTSYFSNILDVSTL